MLGFGAYLAFKNAAKTVIKDNSKQKYIGFCAKRVSAMMN